MKTTPADPVQQLEAIISALEAAGKLARDINAPVLSYLIDVAAQEARSKLREYPSPVGH